MAQRHKGTEAQRGKGASGANEELGMKNEELRKGCRLKALKLFVIVIVILIVID